MFTDMPDDILFLLAKYLDGLNILALSKTCKRFSNFYNNNAVARKLSLNPVDIGYPKNIGAMLYDVIKVIDKNCQSLTCLDLSYFKWKVYRPLICNFLTKLPITKLIIIESDLREDVLKENKLKDLKELTLSLHPYDTSVISYNIKNLTVYFTEKTNCTCYMAQPSFDIQDSTSINKLTLIIHYNFYTFFALHCLKVLIERSNKSSEIVIKFIKPNSVCFERVLHYVPQFYLSSTNTHCIFESLNCIYMSSQLYKETWNCQSLINIEKLKNHGTQQIINIHIFNENTSLEFQNIVDKAKSIIHDRSTKNISLYGGEYCASNGFDTLEYVSKIPRIEQLTLQQCSLPVKINTELNHTVVKRARFSRIKSASENYDILKKVSEIHKDIKGLQILADNKIHNCNRRKHLFTGLHYESILNFKNLRILTVNHKIIVSACFYSKIFVALEQLQILNIDSNRFYIKTNLKIMNELPQNLHLAKNLKILRLHDSLIEINTFLQKFTECQSLKVIDFHYRSFINKTQHPLIELSSITHVLQKCPNVLYLRLTDLDTLKYQNYLRNLEENVKIFNPKMISVNFTSKYHFMNYNLNAFGEFI